MSPHPVPVQYATRLAEEIESVAGTALVGVYLHGSAVYGDWRAPCSDVDVLVVIDDGGAGTTTEGIATVLAAAEPPACPGNGLECSVVTSSEAHAPRPPWPFILHVTTAPDDRKTVCCAPGAGDDDLVLHYLAVHACGHALHGPPAPEVIGAIDSTVVRRHLADELRWAVDHASYSYAVLNACRALRYANDAAVGSKTAGGEWALERNIEPALVLSALDQRARGERAPVGEHARAWVLAVSRQLAANH